jgi:hypothetical protein
MSERDPDIDFDFFDDDPQARESGQTQRISRPRIMRGGGGGGPRRPVRPAAGLMPILRLVGLIAIALAIVTGLVLWAQGCRENKKVEAYESYMRTVSGIARASAQRGTELNTLLTTPGKRVPEIRTQLDGLADREAQDVQRAETTDPPPLLRDEHRALIQALQFRVNGLRGLADTFSSTARARNPDAAGAVLAGQAQRLVASDVVWEDLFRALAVEELQRDGITGVNVPDSDFAQNPDLASTRSMVSILQRIQGATTGGTPTGLHGTAILSVRPLPDGQPLQTGTDNTIVASTDLGFAVTVENGGEHQEVGIKVTLTIQKTPEPIVKTQTIDLIDSGEQEVVTFTDLGEVPFAQKTSLKVDVQPVPGEARTSNNSASYSVIFSLG